MSLPGDVLFDFDKATIRPDARATLDKLAALIAAQKPPSVSIEGHTDAKGDDAYNQRLSEARAHAVRDYLVDQRQVPAALLKAIGLGELRPVAPNANATGGDDPEGRQRNRRVEVVLAAPS
ncbi:OmpA family protein [Sphingomonas baiyangensis]|uniref:OmpA family protein n=1 Tax=Sphingomonas baiyangensis TaxID=2572576 RepID=UPI00146D9AB9|nr:OmpA family protein [Sphingomonas baiyangensis]